MCGSQATSNILSSSFVSNRSSIPIEVPTWGFKAALRRHSMRQQSEVSEAATFVFFGHTAMLLSLIYVSLASISPVVPRRCMSSERQNAQKRRAQSFLSKRRCSSWASEDKATSDSSQGPPPALFRFARKFSLWGPCGGALCGFDHTRRPWGLLLCNESEARIHAARACGHCARR